MEFSIERAPLLRQLLHVTSAVSRSASTLPVLSNLLVELEGSLLKMTGSDLDVQMDAGCAVCSAEQAGSVTIPAHKLLSIVKALPIDVPALAFRMAKGRISMAAGSGCYTLATLPSDEFPKRENISEGMVIELSDALLRSLLSQVAYAIASNDARHYLNGALLELDGTRITLVGSDGARLAVATGTLPTPVQHPYNAILSRKAVESFLGLLQGKDDLVQLSVSEKHVQLRRADQTITSLVIKADYPNYRQVISQNLAFSVSVERNLLADAIKRSDILGSNAKIKHSVSVSIDDNLIRISSSTEDQGDAVEELPVSINGCSVRIGLNARFVIDALAALAPEVIHLRFQDGSKSIVLTDDDGNEHVIMPLRI